MSFDIRANQQVMHKQQLLHGRTRLVRIGNVVAVHGDMATVHFPASKTRSEIPLDQLEPVSARYGRERVQIDPVRRGF